MARDDLPSFSTPSEAFARADLGNIPMPPQQRYGRGQYGTSPTNGAQSQGQTPSSSHRHYQPQVAPQYSSSQQLPPTPYSGYPAHQQVHTAHTPAHTPAHQYAPPPQQRPQRTQSPYQQKPTQPALTSSNQFAKGGPRRPSPTKPAPSSSHAPASHAPPSSGRYAQSSRPQPGNASHAPHAGAGGPAGAYAGAYASHASQPQPERYAPQVPQQQAQKPYDYGSKSQPHLAYQQPQQPQQPQPQYGGYTNASAHSLPNHYQHQQPSSPPRFNVPRKDPYGGGPPVMTQMGYEGSGGGGDYYDDGSHSGGHSGYSGYPQAGSPHAHAPTMHSHAANMHASAPTPTPAASRPQPKRQDLRAIFDGVDRDKNGFLTEKELSSALVNGDYTKFHPNTVRMMLRMFDRNRDGNLYFDEFSQLWKYLKDWRSIFQRFDRDKSECITMDEFGVALDAFGYTLSQDCVSSLFRSGSRPGRNYSPEMSFDMFVQTCINIKTITDIFKTFDTDRDGEITINFEDFLKHVNEFNAPS